MGHTSMLVYRELYEGKFTQKEKHLSENRPLMAVLPNTVAIRPRPFASLCNLFLKGSHPPVVPSNLLCQQEDQNRGLRWPGFQFFDLWRQPDHCVIL